MHGDRVAAHQHAVVVEAEPAVGELVEEVIDVVHGLVERVLEASAAETSSSAENGARPVATALTLRSSQSGVNW